MNEVNLKTRLLMSSMIAGAMFVATAVTPAVAQEDEAVATTEPAAADTESRQERITVTGSRILSPNLTTASPVTSVSSEDIKLQGVTRVEDLVVQLPQAFAAQNSSVSNGASGTATVSLRSLGADRTLVLIDGKRMPYGSPNDAAADLNLIPGQMVERVDVLTGGASAVYGSDALSGVVNFVMKDNFEGFQIDTQYGYFSHENKYDTNGNLLNSTNGNGGLARRSQTAPRFFQLPDENVELGYSKEITAMFGVGSDDGRAHLTGYVGYRNNEDVLQGNYDYSGCSIDTAAAAFTSYNNGADFRCGGSGTSFPGTFTDFSTFSFTLDGNNNFRPNNAGDAYNFGPLNYYQRPDERYTAGFFADYEINPYANAYANFMFMDYSSVAQIAPSGNFFSTSSINCDNPLMSASQAAAIGCSPAEIAAGDSTTLYIGRRNVEGGGRRDNLGYTTYRGVVGLEGTLFDATNWSYDLSAQYSQVSLTRSYQNEFLTSRLNRALNVVTDPGTGAPVCASVLDGTDANCVPYNVFRQNGVTPEALNYLQAPLLQNGQTTQQIVSGIINGDLTDYGFKLPTASTGVNVVFGMEYKRDALETLVDVTFASGDGAGQGGPTLPLSGDVDSYELFTEFLVPLISDAPGVKQLDVSGAFRIADISTGDTTEAFKVESIYAPTDDLRLRASFNRAVRAPNVIELFAANRLGLFDLDNDPCGPSPTATLAQCTATGVPVANYGGPALDSPAGQYNQFIGGNPDLDPEEGDTLTVGFVATPTFLPGLSLSVDYYSIEITNLISTVGGVNIIDLCYTDNRADACAAINRNPANGSLWVGEGFVSNTNVNIGGLETSGIDVNGAYGFEIGQFGALNLSYNGTYIEAYDIDTIGDPTRILECSGFYGGACQDSGPTGTPLPEYRHRARASWDTPWEGLQLATTWRYVGAVELFGGDADRVDFELEEENYFDVAGTWAVNDWAGFRFGVNNVLDNDPPLTASAGTTGNGNTYPQTYDALGRYVFVGVTLDF
ncbi:TonB-dependent receptor [Hyphomonas sp.]|uniref:TonB-dependent receptor domain-containing protein n=1 Tax=Hyphomonas sp. TaxID=87 RepID=UPI0025B97DBF|nr:TonB-dependent receptor [Hyphomonas sp.]